MQIDCGTLRRALKILVQLAPKRPTTPALEHVFVEPTAHGVALVATDGTTCARIALPAKEPIAAGIPMRRLLEFASSLAAGDIHIEHDARAVRVSGSGTTLELPTLPPDAMPAAATFDGDACKVDDASEFISALAWCAEAAGADPTRPHLMGVLLDSDHVVAVDGHRLHVASVAGLACGSALVPTTAVSLAVGLFDGGSVAVGVDPGVVRFATPTWSITTRPSEEKYPPYQQVIPSAANAGFAMIVSTRELAAGLRRAGRRSDRRGVTPVRLRANGAIRLESAVADVQLAASVKVVDSTHVGADFVSGYNARYLRDAIADVDDIATLRFFGAEDPLLIETKNRIAVVMPYRL